MRKRLLISVLCLLFASAFCVTAQDKLRERDVRPEDKYILHYVVVDGDTVFVDNISPAWVFPAGSKVNRAEWRRYARLVYNFNKVYPYAKMAGRILSTVDTEIEEQNMKRGAKERYLSGMQRELLHQFEPVIRHMTISQGQLLTRLLDREMGMTGYQLVRDYRSRLAAGFWQGVAKLFKQDLKSHYDPEGVDKQTEELVKIWEQGDWDAFYFSIFFEYPKKTEIPSQYQ